MAQHHTRIFLFSTRRLLPSSCISYVALAGDMLPHFMLQYFVSGWQYQQRGYQSIISWV